MSDLIDLELEAALRRAVVRDEHGDWTALVVRTQRRRARRAMRLAVVVCALTLLVAAQALGVTPGVGSIFGRSAPAPVKKIFTLPFLAGVDQSTIRLVARTRTADDHTVRLWTAGDRAGDQICIQIQVDARSGGAVSCGKAGVPRIGIGLMDGPGLHGGDWYLGGLLPAQASAVRLRFADGSIVTVPVTRGAWVTALPPARVRYGHDMRVFQVLARSGRVLGSQTISFVQRPIVAVTPKVVVARVGGVALRTASANVGPPCVFFDAGEDARVDSCPGTQRLGLDPGAADQAWMVRVGAPGTFGRLVLFGPLLDGAIRARVVLGDGRSVAARSTRGIFVLPLARPGRSRPARLEYVTASGRIVRQISLAGPKTSLYAPGWHGALYRLVNFGRMNSLNYSVGRVTFPPRR